MVLKSAELAGPLGLGHADTRNHNRRIVVSLIRQFAPVSRRTLMELTGLSRATVFAIADELRVQGLVAEERSAVPSGGRRSGLLSINPGAGFALGVEINSDDAILVLIDLIGVVRKHRHFLHKHLAAEQMLSLVATEAKAMLAETPEAVSRVLGVGVSAPGVLDVASGSVLLASNLEWVDTPVASHLEASLGLPVTVSNHAVSGALAERWLGEPGTSGSYLYIYIGTGIGAGLVWNETAGTVRTQSLPWFGHMSTDAHGPECRCGNYGCLELSASTAAGARSYAAKSAATVTPSWSEVARLAGKGEELALQVVEEMGTHLAAGVTNVLTFSQPDVIILGGRLNLAGTRLTEVVRAQLATRLAKRRSSLDIRTSTLGEEAGAIGVAASVLEGALGDYQLPASTEHDRRVREMR